jgi:hypothetical protein
VGRDVRCSGLVRSRAQSCRATVMVVMEVMRVVETGDHELQSVLQITIKAQCSRLNAECPTKNVEFIEHSALSIGHCALGLLSDEQIRSKHNAQGSMPNAERRTLNSLSILH